MAGWSAACRLPLSLHQNPAPAARAEASPASQPGSPSPLSFGPADSLIECDQVQLEVLMANQASYSLQIALKVKTQLETPNFDPLLLKGTQG